MNVFPEVGAGRKQPTKLKRKPCTGVNSRHMEKKKKKNQTQINLKPKQQRVTKVDHPQVERDGRMRNGRRVNTEREQARNSSIRTLD